jgi:hypothetical protein
MTVLCLCALHVEESRSFDFAQDDKLLREGLGVVVALCANDALRRVANADSSL